MKRPLGIRLFGIALGISSIVLSCVWYDWRLAVIILLALWGNNVERSNNAL